MKQIFLAFIAISFIFTSCKKVVGTGPIVTETRTITDFNSISLEMDATVNITQGNEFKVDVLAQSNILDNIQTTINGTTLHVKHKNNIYIKSDPITINITMPSISNLDVSGSGSLNVINALITSTLDVEVSGSGNIKIPTLNVTNMNSQITGSGEIKINSGTATNVVSEISGSGKLDMIYVISKSVTTETSGSGTTKVYAENTLDVEISGSGNVYYKGYPTINKSISGSGKLINQN